MLETKICTKCNCEKPFEEFYKNKNKKYGLESQCKECLKCKSKEYRESNKEYISLRHKEYVDKNKEKIAEYKKEYYLKNKEKIMKQSSEDKKWLSDDKKQYFKEYTAKNRDKFKKYNKKYASKNKNKIKEKNSKYFKSPTGRVVSANSRHKRRAIEKSGDVTSIQLLELTKNAKNCYWCNTSLKNKVVHIDHYVPLSRGGLHTITNLVVACSECNLKKNAKDPYEFALEKGRLL